MKRKQKLPRRTRRPTSFKPTEDALLFINPKSNEEKLLQIEENSKMPQVQSNSKDKSDVHSKKSVYSESGFLTINQEGVGKKKHQEACGSSENSISKNLGNINFDPLKRGLKRGTDDCVLTGGSPKRPTACGNFGTELEDSKMPIILDVFTLSQLPPYIKKKTADTIRENNFPVTPPCSPPLLNLEKCTGIQNSAFCERNTMRSFSGSGERKHFLNEPIKISNIHNIYRSTGQHDHVNVNNGFPIAINQHMYQTNFTIEDETRKYWNTSHGDGIQIATVEDNTFSHVSNFAPASVVLNERKLTLEPHVKKQQKKFNVDEPSALCVDSMLLQHTQRNNFSNYELLKFGKKEQDNVEKNGPKCLSGSKNGVVCCDRRKQTLKEHETGSASNSNISPNVTCKLSDAVSQSIDECDNGANSSNGLLSPCEIKVLQLKKRLKEQEALLKKLRKNH